MKLETQPRDDHQVKVITELDESDLEKFMHRAARKVAQKVRIPGFRPGKAPYDVVCRHVGIESLEQEALELLVDDVYPKVIDESKVKPSGPGNLEEIISIHPPKLSFIIPLEPEVDLGDYRAIRKEYKLKPVKAAEVKELLERLQRSYATAEPVERAAAEDDIAYLKLSGVLQDAKEDETSQLIKDSPLQVEVGKPNAEEASEFPFKGFGEHLVGLSAGDEKTISYTYPDDSTYEKLRGRTVDFSFLVESIKQLVLPEINDDFAQSVGDFENLDSLKDALKKQLEDNKKAEYESSYFDELVDALVKKATIKFPPQMLEEETDRVLDSIQRELSQKHADLDTYIKSLNKERQQYIDEDIKPVAEKRLARSLVLDALAREEKIEVRNDELKDAYQKLLLDMQQAGDFKKLERQMKPEGLANAIAMEAANRLLNQHILDRLKDIATGNLKEETAEAGAEEPQAAETAGETPETEVKKPARKKAARKTEDAAG